MTQSEQNNCDGCDNDVFLDLGYQPLANQLHNSREESLLAKRYPLRAIIDDNKCIHLDTAVNPRLLYKDYVYNSGVSKPYKDHCKKLYSSLTHLRHDVVIDIGGNDGTLLETFQECAGKKQLRCINVDASESFKETNEAKGIEFVHGFFSDEIDLPKADIITSTNVFQHTKDIHKFLRGIQKYLDGVWILEFPYTLNTLKTLQFDQFYHEHYYYWLVTPLVKLFKQYGLKIIHAQETDIHGGSMLLWMTNKEASAPDGAANRFVAAESDFNYDIFDFEVKEKIVNDLDWIQQLKGRTAFFGAAAKGTVYLNALGLNYLNVSGAYVVDDTPSKQSKFIGGTGFPIKDREYLYRDQPDNLIVLAHNFKDFIESSLRPRYRGRIITMLPTVEVKEIN